MKKDVSILIVHFDTPRLLRQTLKGIFAMQSNVSFEVIVVDHNPAARVTGMIRKEFPFVRLVTTERYRKYADGMNSAMRVADGRYFFVLNPDVIMTDHVLDELMSYMDKQRDVGMVSPKLLNPDKSLQYSCYHFMKPEMVLYQHIPFLRHFFFAKKAIDAYVMKEWDHTETRDVDYVLGAAMFVRRSAHEAIGGFDPSFFVYFEDQDWCRRFWKAGWRVVYHPKAELLHYQHREIFERVFFMKLCNPFTRKQMQSTLYYYMKYRGEENPHVVFLKNNTVDL